VSIAESGIAADEETPTALIPKMNEFPVSNSVYYQKLVLTDPAVDPDDKAEELSGRLDVLGRAAMDAVGASGHGPAVGVLLTFEQGWKQVGLALGELRKSLSLAPGEVTRLAMVDWRRQTTSSEAATRTQTEIVQEQLDDSATLQLVQDSVATEQRVGISMTSGAAEHSESAGNVSFLLWGASASSSTNAHAGLAAAASTGRRDVAASAAKDVERSTEQNAQSARSARATQIREVSESETQSTSTRVVTNYNHGHALTMQYYEVLQIYALQTKVVRAERCVFVPMKTFDFTIQELRRADERFIELLRTVLREYRAFALDEVVGAIRELATTPGQEGEVSEDSIVRYLTEKLTAERAKLSPLMVKLEEAQARLDNATGSDAPGGIAGPAATARAANPLTANVARAIAASAADERASLQQKISDLDTTIAVLSEAASDARRALGVLNENRLQLNQQIWMRIEDYDWHRLLAGKVFPGAPYAGQTIGGLVDPTPIGYFGNFVAFKWDFPRVVPAPSGGGTGAPADTTGEAEGASGSTDSIRSAEEFEAMFTEDTMTVTQVALPTEGLFAEAVLGRSNGAERIDMTRFWNWQDSPIPILPPSMSPVDSDSRARGVAPVPKLLFERAVVKLREVGTLPEDVENAAIEALQQAISTSDDEIVAASGAAQTAGEEALIGAGRASQAVMDMQRNFTSFLVDMANSKAATAATEIGLAAATGGTSVAAKGGLSSIGGLLNQSNKLAEVADTAAQLAVGAEGTDGAADDE
jgi:hypothetical protein